MLPRGIEPRSMVLQTIANPSQLEKLGATYWIRTSTSCLLRAVRLPIAPKWLGPAGQTRTGSPGIRNP